MIEAGIMMVLGVAVSNAIQKRKNPCPTCRGEGKIERTIKSGGRRGSYHFHKTKTRCVSCDGRGYK